MFALRILRTAFTSPRPAVSVFQSAPCSSKGPIHSTHKTYFLKLGLSARGKQLYRQQNPVPEKKLIPAPLPEHEERICLVLDLDETLMHGTHSEPEQYDFDFSLEYQGTEFRVYVHLRPHLDEFLEAVGRRFELVVYTASVKEYADRIIDHIDPKRLITHRLYREHCGILMEQYVKDLEFIGRPLSRTILIDNNPISYVAHPDHGIPILSYFGPADNQLKELLDFLETLQPGKELLPKVVAYSDNWRKIMAEKYAPDDGTDDGRNSG